MNNRKDRSEREVRAQCVLMGMLFAKHEMLSQVDPDDFLDGDIGNVVRSLSNLLKDSSAAEDKKSLAAWLRDNCGVHTVDGQRTTDAVIKTVKLNKERRDAVAHSQKMATIGGNWGVSDEDYLEQYHNKGKET